MTTEATIRLVLAIGAVAILRELIRIYLLPLYKRIEDKSRAKSEARLTSVLASMQREPAKHQDAAHTAQ